MPPLCMTAVYIHNQYRTTFPTLSLSLSLSLSFSLVLVAVIIVLGSMAEVRLVLEAALDLGYIQTGEYVFICHVI